MYLEDLVVKIQPIFLDPWHRQFIHSVADQLNDGRSLSTRQVAVILKFIRQHRRLIETTGWATEEEIDRLLIAPEFHTEPYQSTSMRREVRYLGDNLLAFRFKPDAALLDKIKLLGNATSTRWLHYEPTVAVVPHRKPRFDWLYKLWIVPVYGFNLNSIRTLIQEERFRLDHMATKYLALASRSFRQPSLFAIDHDNQVILANVCDHPILATWITEVAEGIAV